MPLYERGVVSACEHCGGSARFAAVSFGSALVDRHCAARAAASVADVGRARLADANHQAETIACRSPRPSGDRAANCILRQHFA